MSGFQEEQDYLSKGVNVYLLTTPQKIAKYPGLSFCDSPYISSHGLYPLMRCEGWNPNMAMFSGNCALFASSLQSHVSEQWNILLRFALRRAVRPACALTHLLKTNSRATVAGHCAVSAKPAQCSLTLFGHRKWPAEARSDEEAARTMAVTRAGYCFLCVELKVFVGWRWSSPIQVTDV